MSVDEPLEIEYRISTNGDSSNEWIKYDKPFKLERSDIIYSRAKTLWYTCEEEYRAAYLSENGLVYFGSAEEPGDTILSISASYNIKDPMQKGVEWHFSASDARNKLKHLYPEIKF